MSISNDPLPSRTLLLVDDEPNILTALQRALRRDGYRILATDDPLKGLEMLAGEPVDVILSDQRMPGMSGVEFLRRAKETHPETMRIVLSGYTDLQFITDAINEGAIYKFLTKPWDDEQLREQIREAFRSKEAADENLRLNQALQAANVELQAHVSEQARQARQIETVLDTLQEVLQLIPWPILGVDEEGMIALSNSAADTSLGGNDPLLGREAREALPEAMRTWLAAPAAIPEKIHFEDRWYRVIYKPMGLRSRSRGVLLALQPCETPA
ncbi:MAG: response regulator [Pseudomonadota bacterium]|nr:response regulator [Pseudomonadota bacterium]MDP1905726.1 response regulator [Pseudomonadota bacterium]MDP2353598.1 response regulator [Pseudomonadota bacterium]